MCGASSTIDDRSARIGQKKGPNGLLHPDAIADSYWYLHTQHRSAWSQELDVRPYAETFLAQSRPASATATALRSFAVSIPTYTSLYAVIVRPPG
jgi:hypothetical protein